MARHCTCCTDPRREQIDELLQRGTTPYAAIARQFGKSITSLRRHRQLHLPEPPPMALALPTDPEHERQDEAAAEIRGKLAELDAELRAMQEQGKAKGDLRLELGAIDRRLRLLELQLKELTAARAAAVPAEPSTTNNVLAISVDPKTAERIASAYLLRRQLLPPGEHDA
jgi:hypothetical protein